MQRGKMSSKCTRLWWRGRSCQILGGLHLGVRYMSHQSSGLGRRGSKFQDGFRIRWWKRGRELGKRLLRGYGRGGSYTWRCGGIERQPLPGKYWKRWWVLICAGGSYITTIIPCESCRIVDYLARGSGDVLAVWGSSYMIMIQAHVIQLREPTNEQWDGFEVVTKCS